MPTALASSLRALAVGVGLLAVAAPARAADAPSPQLTLESAIDLALANNERALKAPPRVEAAAGGVERARAAFLPTLTAQGNGGWQSTADKNGRNFSGDGQLQLSQGLVSPSAYPLYAQAEHTLASERWGAVEDLRVLAFDTASAFIAALSTEQLLIAAQQRLSRAQADMDDTSARAQAGLTSSNDVTRASLAVSTAQTQVAQAQGNLSRAYLQLAYLIGKPVTGGLVAPEQTTNKARHGQWNPAEVERRAEGRRPDLLSATEHTAALFDFAREPLYRLIPTLGLSAQLKQIIDPAPMDVGLSENASLTLTWTIYDAGVALRRSAHAAGASDQRVARRARAQAIDRQRHRHRRRRAARRAHGAAGVRAGRGHRAEEHRRDHDPL